MNSSYPVETTYGVSQSVGIFGVIAAIGTIFWIVIFAVLVLQIIAMWKLFKKAGKPGWASLVPIYNTYIMCEIGEKAWWYVLLTFVPVVNIFALFMIYYGIAKKFGKEIGFAIGMFLLPPIFFMILGFGKSSIAVDENVNDISDDNIENFATDINVNENQDTQKIEEAVINNNNSENFQDTPNQGYQAPTFENTNMQNNNLQMNNSIMNNQFSSVVNEAPTMSAPVQPVVNEAPTMSAPVQPVVNEAPTMSAPVQPVVNEVPTMSAPVQPVVNEAPTMNTPVQPVVNEVPTMNTPAQPVVNEAPTMSAPVQPVVNEAPTMNTPVQPVVNEAPTMNTPVQPVVNEAPTMSAPVQPVVNEAPTMNTPAQPVVNEQTTNQQEVETLEEKPRTSMWSNNNNNQ